MTTEEVPYITGERAATEPLARVMRGPIIDYARSRQALKRGGGFEITSLVEEVGDRALGLRQRRALAS